MAKYNVLVTARSFGTVDDLAVNLLQEHDCEIKKLEEKDGPIPEQLKKELPAADAVIAGLEDYGRELIESAGHLKVISRYGVGYDKVRLFRSCRRPQRPGFCPTSPRRRGAPDPGL